MVPPWVQLMRMAEGAPLGRRPLWERGDLSREALVLEYLRECRIVRKGLDGNLLKARNMALLPLHTSPVHWCSRSIDTGGMSCSRIPRKPVCAEDSRWPLCNPMPLKVRRHLHVYSHTIRV